MEFTVSVDTTAIIVSVVAVSLGLVGAILGFVAHGTYLTDPDTSAGLGIGAAILLLLSQTTVSVAGGCFGCCNQSRAVVVSENRRIIGILCGVISWVLAVVALLLLLIFGVLEVRVYAGGGVLILLATVLAVTSFIMLRGQPAASEKVTMLQGQPADAEAGKQNGSAAGEQEQKLPAGTEMTGQQPQFPPAADQPSEAPPTADAVPEIVVGHPQLPASAVSHAQAGHESLAPTN